MAQDNQSPEVRRVVLADRKGRGQLRYSDVLDRCHADRATVDRTLISLCQEGLIALRPHGDVLRIERVEN